MFRNDKILDSESISYLEMNDKTLKNVIRMNGKYTKKNWEGKELEIYEFIQHTDNFLAILWENNEESYVYEELKYFDLEEISFENYVKGEEYRIYLLPTEYHQLIASNTSNVANYSYNYKTKYRIFEKAPSENKVM